MTTLRVIDWNVFLFATKEDRARQAELLNLLKPDLLLLQEVKAHDLRTFVKAGVATDFVLSNLTPTPARHARRRIGTAVMVGPRLSIVRERSGRIPQEFFVHPDADAWLVERNGERSLVAEIETESGQRFAAGSFHASPGTGKRIGGNKPLFHRGVANYMGTLDLPFVFGIDANEPFRDLPDPAQSRFAWKAERPGVEHFEALLGQTRVHRGRDLLRESFERAPWPLEAEGGPLRTTCTLRGGGRRRFDHIYATPEFHLTHIDVRCDGKRTCGSDHGLLTADLELRPLR